MGLKQAGEMTLHERLKAVARWHFRGISSRKIADMIGSNEQQIRRDIKTITSQIREFPDIEAHLRDLVARLGEEITKITELEAEQWKLLDWATEEVVQVGGAFMSPIAVVGDNGQPKKDEYGNIVYEKGPRKPTMVPVITAQIANLSKQKAEYLKIIGPKVDVSINLNLQLRTQALIMEKLRSLDPTTYALLYNELQVLVEASGQKALPVPSPDAIDAEFTPVVDHA